MAEGEGDLVRVHGPGPLRPGRGGGHLGEVVHVDVLLAAGVLVAELEHGAGELPVPGEPVHGHPVVHGVLRVRPLGVLVLDSSLLESVGKWIRLFDQAFEILPGNEGFLGTVFRDSWKKFVEGVENKIISLILVGSE